MYSSNRIQSHPIKRHNQKIQSLGQNQIIVQYHVSSHSAYDYLWTQTYLHLTFFSEVDAADALDMCGCIHSVFGGSWLPQWLCLLIVPFDWMWLDECMYSTWSTRSSVVRLSVLGGLHGAGPESHALREVGQSQPVCNPFIKSDHRHPYLVYNMVHFLVSDLLFVSSVYRQTFWRGMRRSYLQSYIVIWSEISLIVRWPVEFHLKVCF